MSSNEMVQTLDYVARQRGLSREDLCGMLEEAICQAARRADRARNYENVEAHIDPRNGNITCTAKLTVVDEVSDASMEITQSMARTQVPNATVGEVIDWPIRIADLGRIAAQAAKQVLSTGLISAEKNHVAAMYKEREGKLITGTVIRKDLRNGVWIQFENAEGLMPPKACIPGEEFTPGEPITVLLKTINTDKPGASLYVTRSSIDFVRALFEREVSEIGDGTVEIKAIAREPGYRTKIAVYSEQPKVDPVGACVGVRGARVRTIVSELGGEKVDIINWDPDVRVYVENALKPAKLASVLVDEEKHFLDVRVVDDQLSLSIGRKGQNARLAAKLTGWKIDIKKVEKQEAPQVTSMQEQIQAAIELFKSTCGIDEATAEALVGNGYHSIEGLREATVEDLLAIEGISPATAASILASIQG